LFRSKLKNQIPHPKYDGELIQWAKGWECKFMPPIGRTYPRKSTDAVSRDVPIKPKVVGCWVDEDVLAPNTFNVDHF
jgi:hypothetical protein